MGAVRRVTDMLAVAGVAAVLVASQSNDGERTTLAVSQEPVVATAPAAAPALGPVTVHAIDRPVVDAPLAAAPGAVVEVVQLAVVGGSLSLVDDHATVTLVRDGSQWSGSLPPVRVVDARGTHAGWRVSWKVVDVETDGCRAAAPGLVRVAPSPPVVIDGTLDGLVAGDAGRTLARAQRGSGGGTYEAGGTVSVRLPSCSDAGSVVVELSYAVR